MKTMMIFSFVILWSLNSWADRETVMCATPQEQEQFRQFNTMQSGDQIRIPLDRRGQLILPTLIDSKEPVGNRGRIRNIKRILYPQNGLQSIEFFLESDGGIGPVRLDGPTDFEVVSSTAGTVSLRDETGRLYRLSCYVNQIAQPRVPGSECYTNVVLAGLSNVTRQGETIETRRPLPLTEGIDNCALSSNGSEELEEVSP